MSAVQLIPSLLGAVALAAQYCADDSATKPSNHELVHSYECAGDFANALNYARKGYEESSKIGLDGEIRFFSNSIKRLENELLEWGSSLILFDENQRPKPRLVQLLQVVGFETANSDNLTLSKINDWAQKNLLRQGERWQQQSNRFEELKETIKPLLKELGFIDGHLPHFREYQGAIVHGALLPRLRLRLNYLVEQWNQGIRFKRLYFLSGDRPLQLPQEGEEALLKCQDLCLKMKNDWTKPSELPKTEIDMVRMVWEQSEIPKEMREKVVVDFICAPMKKDAKGALTIRPTTDDTVKAWMEAPPPCGNYLAITNAPYINRQDLVTRTIASGDYGFDTIGSEANDQEKIAILLDELARLIFQCQEIEKTKT